MSRIIHLPHGKTVADMFDKVLGTTPLPIDEYNATVSTLNRLTNERWTALSGSLDMPMFWDMVLPQEHALSSLGQLIEQHEPDLVVIEDEPMEIPCLTM